MIYSNAEKGKHFFVDYGKKPSKNAFFSAFRVHFVPSSSGSGVGVGPSERTLA
jgi:hypothetical protein